MKKLLDTLLGMNREERRIGLLTGGVLVFITLMTGSAVFYTVSRQLDQELEKSIVRMLDDREKLFLSELEYRIEDAREAAARPHLAHLMKQAGTKGTNDLLQLELQGILDAQRLAGVTLLDVQGRSLLTLGKFTVLPEVAVALQTPADVTLRWKDNYYLRLDAPIREGERLLGTLRMELPLKNLSAMAMDYHGLGESGEMLVCAPLGFDAMQCLPSRHQPHGFQTSRVRDNQPLPMSMALDGKTGFIVARDYRSQEVFDAYKPIGATGLGMVVKIDTDELERPIRNSLSIGVGVLALFVLLGVGLLHWLAGPVIREMIATRGRLKLAHDETIASHTALLKAHQSLTEADTKIRKAEAENERQMSALAEANVRMVFYHDTMKLIREADSTLEKGGRLDEFCHLVIIQTMNLTRARYGAIGLFGTDGTLNRFISEGIDSETRAKMGEQPHGQGLLQAFYKEDKIVRVDDIAADPRSCGFPPHHPGMKSLLGVPMGHRQSNHGVLYLADKNGGEPFTENDEILIGMLAAECGNILERHYLLTNRHEFTQALEREHEEQRLLIAKLEQTQSQLLQSDKMASIGQLAAGVAHEINNPVGFVYSNLGTLEKYLEELFAVLEAYEQAQGDASRMNEVEVLKKKFDLNYLKEDVPALMRESRDGIIRVKKIVQDLKDFSHVDSSDEWQWVDLHKGLDSTLNIVWNEIKYKAELKKEYGVLPEIECLPSQLNQVFMNLLVNASHAIEEHGVITLRTGVEGDDAWVEVIDTGKGIPAENLNRIFDPFFTTKEVGKGTGLGLSLSYGIVHKHGGSIEVVSEVGRGTTFRVRLPIKHEADLDAPDQITH